MIGDDRGAGQSPIQSAKARHSIADVAARTGIHLPPHAGRLVTVRCPMPSHGHPDRNPSLRLDLHSGHWWCFGCSPTTPRGTPQAGDVVDWVGQTENVDIRGAIAILDSGRQLTNAWAGHTATAHYSVGSGTGRSERPDPSRTLPDRIQEALEAAWSFYTEHPRHRSGQLYLHRRGIDVTVLERYNGRAEIGFTASPATGVVDWMRRRGFCDDDLVDAALARRNLDTGRLTDYYQQRVLLSVRDAEQRICGFIGRNLGDHERPKYINPPTTACYDKSINLYVPLPSSGTPGGQAVVVEGPFDAMAIAVAAVASGQPGRFCPMTQSGRELSPRQVRYALVQSDRPLLLCMDGDRAGRESNRRIALAVERAGGQAVIVDLPDGHDPASLIAQRGPASLSVLVASGRVLGRTSADQMVPSLPRGLDVPCSDIGLTRL